MFARSMRWRLQIWHGLILLGVVIGLEFAAYHLERRQRMGAIDQELQERSTLLTGFVRPPGAVDDRARADPEFRVPPPVAQMFDATATSDFYFIVWLRDGTEQTHSAKAPQDVPRPEPLAPGHWQASRTRGTVREFFLFTMSGRCILIGRPIIAELNGLHLLAWRLAAMGAAAIVLGLLAGWWVTSRALRPVRDISATASRIASGDLSQRINVAETHNELGHLATVLNSTFARLESAFQQQKQFTADAAHQLRTPVSVIISEIQTTLASERSPAEYREGLEACLETAQQMGQLIEALLDLARLDSSEEQLKREPVELAQIAHACIEGVRPLARARNTQIQSALVPVRTLGNPTRISQVLTNILTNAINYTRPGGEVRVSTFSELPMAGIMISDNGPGIAPEDLPHIFERFYRGEKARSRAAGHTGLGLAICKAIVEAHGGSIQVLSRLEVGTTFTIRLPLLGSP